MPETLTFCLECGARVTDWTDGVCPDSADKRHGPLSDGEYVPAAGLRAVLERWDDLSDLSRRNLLEVALKGKEHDGR